MPNSLPPSGALMALDIAQVKTALDDLFSQRQPPPSWEEQRETVIRLGQPDLFTSLIETILSDQALLHKVASRSYIHENKFDKIVLMSSSNPDYKLRLHVWWPSPEAPHTETIHNHQWTLSSIVLVGALHWQEFIPANAGSELLHYTYKTRPGLRNLPKLAMGPVALDAFPTSSRPRAPITAFLQMYYTA